MAVNVVINGVTYSDVPEVQIPLSGGGTASFMDTSDATLTSGDQMLSGYSAYSDGTKFTGSIATKTSENMTVSGGTVTVPAGYYATNQSKSIANGSATTPATTISVTPSMSVNSSTGVVTGTVSDSESVTPTVSAGYVASGTAGTITVSGSDTLQLDTTSVTAGTTSVSGSIATRGTAEWDTGWIQSGEISAATFANSGTAGTTYVDISSTTDAPVLVTGDYLYINQGFVDNLKISLAKLVPDGASADLSSSVILLGYTAYNNAGQEVAGSIPSKAAATYNTSSSDQTINSGQYLSGNQVIKAVLVSGVSAANIKAGTTIKVGDANDDDRIASATGTFTASSTVSSGQTAAAAGQVLTGYSAWVDGSEVKGSIANNGGTGGTISTKAGTVNIPAGYTTGGSVSISSTEQAKIIAGNIKSGVTILGQAGSSTVVDTAIASGGATAGKILSGYSAYVNGSLVQGSVSMPTVSQDATTKVLTVA